MNPKIIFLAVAMAAGPACANAIEWRGNGYGLSVTGYGTAGMIDADKEKPDFLGDWRIRGEARHDMRTSRIGLVYALDAQTVDSDEYIDDLFLFWQSRRYGRMEIGMTDSAAGKLGLGLPDVGALRVNDNPLFYKKINPDGPVVADGTVDSGDQVLRLNLVTNSIGGAQYGVSVATLADGYDYAIDAGVKVRWPSGKIKTAVSLGTSFIDNPHDFDAEPYAPGVTADWRAQMAAGLNVQYNSWIFGLNARAVYDYDTISPAADGLSAGAGISYDLLNYSMSLSYIISAVGIWHEDDHRYTNNTVLGSFRYKYSANVDGWTSIGVASKTPFVSAGLRLTF
ncbi:MAG: hypothetical protein K2I81_04405 [Alphaproteobacteria bacterium]|nr:hypothetical protein [Alphaproteobacteria bacterium]